MPFDDDQAVAASQRRSVAVSRPVAVSINHLSKTYPVSFARLKRFLRRRVKPPVEALRDVSFDVHAGEIFGLIGRNGAGKTTLTKIVATLVQPTSGTVTVNGFDSVREEERVRAQIGLATAEERSFYWRLTAQQNLIFFARLYGLNDQQARRRIGELIARFELEEVARRRFGELSTGNKQRMAFARAMLAQPPVLLLDEPTRSLDPLAAARMRSLINELSQADPPVSILLTSHNLAEVEELCERVAIISRGQIRALGPPQSLRSDHKPTERVRIIVGGLARARAEVALQPLLKDIELTETPDRLVVAFTREIEDRSLDLALRQILENGGATLAIETESATLLDVLESYEREEQLDGESLEQRQPAGGQT
ncbi:MAG: type transport system ATP-binding protein [Blastocatellia bacterium]|nr:type transport system ATP-binding protein [Blastocatellia bacterium]